MSAEPQLILGVLQPAHRMLRSYNFRALRQALSRRVRRGAIFHKGSRIVVPASTSTRTIWPISIARPSSARSRTAASRDIGHDRYSAGCTARRDRLRPDVGSRPRLCAPPSPSASAFDSRTGPRRSLRRRHAEVPAATRRRAAHRIRLHPRHAEADLLHLEPGWLRDGLRLLSDRQDGFRPQPHACRNHGPGPCPRCRHGAPWAAVQHRAHGDGRAAAQLRPYDDVAAHPHGRARLQPAGPPHHVIDRRALSPRCIGALPQEPIMPNLAISLHATTEPAAGSARADQSEISAGGADRRLPAVPAQAPQPDHVRIRPPGGRERHARRRATVGDAPCRREGQGQLVAAQRGPGHPLRAAIGGRASTASRGSCRITA